MRLSSLPIPEDLSELLLSQGYEDLYPPQEEAIKVGVLEGKNLLLATPTASGKTLVAMLAVGKTILEDKGKVIYLTPLRALAQEKYEEFKQLETLTKSCGDMVKVLISTGDYDSKSELLSKGDVLIMTNEKFDSLLRHGVSWIDEVSLFVADEVHLVGDIYRGPTIETILTKIIAFTPEAQIIALSATIKNAKEFAKWLNARIVDIEWRPVSLREGVYMHGEVYFSDNTKRKIDPTNRGLPIDLSADTVRDGGQSLIFTETRRRSVSLAMKASEVASSYLTESEKDEAKMIANKIRAMGEETATSRKLASAVELGAAFHHAGLNIRHRLLIEEAFKKRVIKILSATPTLAAGVNLPARRVVLSSLFRYDSDLGGQTPISVLDYKQMCGRAGRPKFDLVGETVLVSRSVEEADEIYLRYIKGSPEPIGSQLSRSDAFRTHVLAIIATLPGITKRDIYLLFSKTLFANQYGKTTVKTKINESLYFLTSEDLIEKRGKRFVATDFGKRIAMLYIDPATGIEFRNAIKHAEERHAKMVGLLHLITTVPDFTPKLPMRRGDWDECELYLKDHIDEFIVPVPDVSDIDSYENFLRGFRILITLWSWMEEVSEEKIRERFGVESGDLHRAVESTDWLLYSLSEVCKIVDKTSYLKQIDVLRRRMKYGIRTELLPLIVLEGVGRVRARALYKAGYKDLRMLKLAPVERIAEIDKIGFMLANKIKSLV